MSLAENKLEEKGTKAICKALEQNKTLKELDIAADILVAATSEGQQVPSMWPRCLASTAR